MIGLLMLLSVSSIGIEGQSELKRYASTSEVQLPQYIATVFLRESSMLLHTLSVSLSALSR